MSEYEYDTVIRSGGKRLTVTQRAAVALVGLLVVAAFCVGIAVDMRLTFLVLICSFIVIGSVATAVTVSVSVVSWVLDGERKGEQP